MHPIWIILLLWHKHSTHLQHQRNWWQLPLTAACRPSRANDGATVLAARPQLSIRLHCHVLINSTLPINPAKPDPTRHFQTDTPRAMIQSHIFHQIHFIRSIIKSTRLIKTAKPAPPSHFLNNTPISAIQFRIFHQITCPSKPFLNRHVNRSDTLPSFSLDYLTLQDVFEPTSQALWTSPVFFIRFIPSNSSSSPPYWSSLPRLHLQGIFEPTQQALRFSTVIPHHIHYS